MDGSQGNCEFTKITSNDRCVCAFVFRGEDLLISLRETGHLTRSCSYRFDWLKEGRMKLGLN